MKLKTYVINLNRSPERLEFMSNQLSHANISFEKIEAIDGKLFDFTNYYDEKLSQKLNGILFSPGEKGCALSHILEYEVDMPESFKKIQSKTLLNSKFSNFKIPVTDFYKNSLIF